MIDKDDPHRRMLARLAVQAFKAHSTEHARVTQPHNTDHSLGRLLWRDPENYALGYVNWSL